MHAESAQADRPPATTASIVRLALALALSALVLTAVAGCGGGSNNEPAGASPASAKTVDLADFPRTDGKKTLVDLQREVDAAQDANLLPATNDFVARRPNRLPFGLFDADRKMIWGPTAVYIASGTNSPAIGPLRANGHTFDVPERFQSSTSKSDLNTVGNGFYTATLPAISKPQKLGVLTLTKVGDKFQAAAASILLTAKDPTVAPGEQAIVVDTPTGNTAEELDKIDTRNPHDDMHRISLPDALKLKKPTVLIFATPQLCASRICGPVVDVAEEVHHELGDKVTFIHNEIYRDNDINKGYRSQVKAWGLPMEPFTFVIDARGKVVEQLQGPFDADELRAAIAKAQKVKV